MQISKHFTVNELVNPDIINRLGQKRAANLISIYLIKSLEALRLKYGPIVINGRYGNNYFKDSGLRKASYYKKFGVMRESYSTHQYGNTADLKFKGISPIKVYNYILANPEEFPFIVRMENAYETKTWLHIECGKYRDKIEVFDP